jgi:NarL family two-component system response regulator LiaR
VDDHDLFRVGLVSVLAAHADIEVIGQASSASIGVRLASELRPDVVLMDLRMPDLDGAEATRKLREQTPSTRVLALSMLSGESHVADAVAAGACGYLLKDSPVDDVVAAVRAAAQGAAWLSPRAADAILERIRVAQTEADSPSDADELSPRELEVLQLVGRGLDNGGIAAELCISPRTAKNHVSSILAKLRVPNRVQAAIFAVRNGLA